MTRSASCEDNLGCSCRVAVPSTGRVGVGGPSSTVMEPREWHGEGEKEEEQERSRQGCNRVGQVCLASLCSLPWGSRWEFEDRDQGSSQIPFWPCSLGALVAPTRRVLVYDVVTPLPPVHTLKYFSSLGRLTSL